jgi:hypothetical protein
MWVSGQREAQAALYHREWNAEINTVETKLGWWEFNIVLINLP